MSIPRPLSVGEETFALHCSAHGLKPEREYQFDPYRRWRFDFALVPEQIAIEIEGGIWSGGAHTRGKHFESDAAKYNRAVILGWRILRYSTAMVESGQAIHDVLEIILP